MKVKIKVILEFAKTKSGKVIVSCVAALILILAIFVLIPAVTNKFSATIVAELPDGRIFTGNITLEDGQVADEEDADRADVSNEEFSVEVKVRLTDSEDRTWHNAVDANVGDIVEFQIQYKNTSAESHRNVMICDVLPENLKYVDGTTKIFNTKYPEGGQVVENTIAENGLNIGHYAASANAYIRFTAEVIDNSLAYGSNTLVNWAQGQAGTDENNRPILKDYATVMVQKSE